MVLHQKTLLQLATPRTFVGQHLSAFFGPNILQSIDSQSRLQRWKILRELILANATGVTKRDLENFEEITRVAEAQERAEKILWYIGFRFPQKLALRIVKAKYGLINALKKAERERFVRCISRLAPDEQGKLLEDCPEEWRKKLEGDLERDRRYRAKQGRKVPTGISAKDAALVYGQDRTDTIIVHHWLEFPTGLAGLAFLSESQSMIVFEYLRKHCGAQFLPSDPAVFRQRRKRLGLRTANPRHPIYKDVALEREQGRLGLTFVDQGGNRKWTWFRLKPRNSGGGNSG